MEEVLPSDERLLAHRFLGMALPQPLIITFFELFCGRLDTDDHPNEDADDVDDKKLSKLEESNSESEVSIGRMPSIGRLDADSNEDAEDDVDDKKLSKLEESNSESEVSIGGMLSKEIRCIS